MVVKRSYYVDTRERLPLTRFFRCSTTVRAYWPGFASAGNLSVVEYPVVLLSVAKSMYCTGILGLDQ